MPIREEWQQIFPASFFGAVNAVKLGNGLFRQKLQFTTTARRPRRPRRKFKSKRRRKILDLLSCHPLFSRRGRCGRRVVVVKLPFYHENSGVHQLDGIGSAVPGKADCHGEHADCPWPSTTRRSQVVDRVWHLKWMTVPF